MQLYADRAARPHGGRFFLPPTSLFSETSSLHSTEAHGQPRSPAIESLASDPYEYECLERLDRERLGRERLAATELSQRQDRSHHGLLRQPESRVRKKQSTSSSLCSDLSGSRVDSAYSEVPRQRAGRRTAYSDYSTSSSTPASSGDADGNPLGATHGRIVAIVDEVMVRLQRDQDEAREVEDAAKGFALTQAPAAEASAKHGLIDFKKTWQYANSRLPASLSPMKFHLATWPIICTAIQASRDAYFEPKKAEREDFLKANWRRDVKAAKFQTRAIDGQNVIIVAIRGTKSNMDWRTNFRLAPVEPMGFLDDEGNACHAGYLQTARAMMAPVAMRIRHLLEQDPSRASSTLLLTGHSAGGAVASLLYMHMMATKLESDLNSLTKLFNRVHCVTFGTPPLSLLPLQNPADPQCEQNVFLTFVNEGDPVVRADKQYLSTFYKCIAAPAPLPATNHSLGRKKKRSRMSLKSSEDHDKDLPLLWPIPPATLCNPGRIVVLREKPAKRDVVEAVQVTDEDLRDVLFGDPEMHWTDQYLKRIDGLAFAAITGRVND